MGACSGSGCFVSTDWKTGIREIQRDAEDMYGEQDGYSGAPNSCEFIYKGEYFELGKNTKKATEQLNAFIDSRLDCLGTGDGEVIKVGIDGYVIINTVFKEVFGYAPFDRYYFLQKMGREPALLLKENPYKASTMNFVIVEGGTISELKKSAHKLMRQEKYSCNYYILSKNHLYFCTKEEVKKEKTSRKTNEKYLVLPLYKFIYYGWYRE